VNNGIQKEFVVLQIEYRLYIFQVQYFKRCLFFLAKLVNVIVRHGVDFRGFLEIAS